MPRWPILLVAALFPARPARADGDGPLRAMTAPEAAAFETLRAGIEEALPKAPAGTTSAFGAAGDPAMRRIPVAVEPEGMLRMSFTATQTLNRDVRDARLRSLYTDRARGTPEQQAALEALRARSAELRKARDRSRDRAEKDRIRSEMRKVNAEENRLMEEATGQVQAWVATGGAAAAQRDLEKSLPAGKLTARFLVNGDVSVDDRAVPYGSPGAFPAFEQRDGCPEAATSCITVLLGGFDREKRVRGYTRYAPRRGPGGAVPTRARAMVLIVSGPGDRPESARAFLGQVNLAKLKTLLE